MEKIEELKMSEKEFSNHVVDKHFKCDKCNSFFKTKYKMKRHIESVHERKKPFKCNVCDASFAQNAKLVRHTAHSKSLLVRGYL